jgi:hypothetical protein
MAMDEVTGWPNDTLASRSGSRRGAWPAAEVLAWCLLALAVTSCDSSSLSRSTLSGPLSDPAGEVGPFRLVDAPTRCEVHGSVRNTRTHEVFGWLNFDAFDTGGTKISSALADFKVPPLGTVDYTTFFVQATAPGQPSTPRCGEIARAELVDVNVYHGQQRRHLTKKERS